jgi:hypothetical protein
LGVGGDEDSLDPALLSLCFREMGMAVPELLLECMHVGITTTTTATATLMKSRSHDVSAGKDKMNKASVGRSKLHKRR